MLETEACVGQPARWHAGPWTAPHDAGLGWGWGRGEAEALPSKGRAVRSLWGCWTRPRPSAAGTALCCVCALSGGRSLWEPQVGLGQQTGGGPRRPPSMQDPRASAPGRTGRGGSGGHTLGRGDWGAGEGMDSAGGGRGGGAGTALVAQSQSYQGGLGTQPRSASETQNSHPSSPGPTRPSNTILFSLKKQRCFRKCWLQFEKYSFYLIHRR